MDNKFSWMVIERDERKAYLVLYNKKGLRKVLNSRPLGYEHELEAIKERRQALNDKIGKALADAIEEGMKNPEEFIKRLERK